MGQEQEQQERDRRVVAKVSGLREISSQPNLLPGSLHGTSRQARCRFCFGLQGGQTGAQKEEDSESA